MGTDDYVKVLALILVSITLAHGFIFWEVAAMLGLFWITDAYFIYVAGVIPLTKSCWPYFLVAWFKRLSESISNKIIINSAQDSFKYSIIPYLNSMKTYIQSFTCIIFIQDLLKFIFKMNNNFNHIYNQQMPSGVEKQGIKTLEKDFNKTAKNLIAP